MANSNAVRRGHETRRANMLAAEADDWRRDPNALALDVSEAGPGHRWGVEPKRVRYAMRRRIK
jgi:hypothetical protein